MWGGLWALLFPVFLLLGLRFGIFTPSEIGAFAVVYAVVVACSRIASSGAHRSRRSRAASPTSARSCCCSRSAVFGYGIVFERVPEVISAWMLDLTRRTPTWCSSSSCFSCSRRDLHRGRAAHHHADADLPAARHPGRRRPGAFRPDLRHRRDHRQLHAAGGAALFAVCQILNARWASTRANRCPSWSRFRR